MSSGSTRRSLMFTSSAAPFWFYLASTTAPLPLFVAGSLFGIIYFEEESDISPVLICVWLLTAPIFSVLYLLQHSLQAEIKVSKWEVTTIKLARTKNIVAFAVATLPYCVVVPHPDEVMKAMFVKQRA